MRNRACVVDRGKKMTTAKRHHRHGGDFLTKIDRLNSRILSKSVAQGGDVIGNDKLLKAITVIEHVNTNAFERADA